MEPIFKFSKSEIQALVTALVFSHDNMSFTCDCKSCQEFKSRLMSLAVKLDKSFFNDFNHKSIIH